MIDNYDLIKRNNNKNFVINDIELFVDPTSISIHKENLEYSYKTLRSKGSTKVASGNGALHLQLNLVFSPEMIIQLHRLICQIRNIPFVYIKNDFIERSIGLGIHSTSSHFTVFGFALNNHQSSPGSFVCQIDLRYFNTQPYSNTVEYLHDYKYVSKDNTKTYKYTHGVYEKYSRIKSSEDNRDYSKSVINTNDPMNSIYQKLSINENPYKEYEYNTSFYDPRYSNAYKRYSNYIQYQSLKDNFGIQIIKQENTDYKDLLTLRINENLYNTFESADVIYPFYAIDDDELLEFNKNLSYAILSKALDFRIYYKNFIRQTFNPKLLKKFRKTLYMGVTKNMNYSEIEKKKRENFNNLIKYREDFQHSEKSKNNSSTTNYYFIRPYYPMYENINDIMLDLYILHYPGFNGTLDLTVLDDNKVKFTIKSDSGKETIKGTGQNIVNNLESGSYSIDENNLDLFILNQFDLQELEYIDNREEIDRDKFTLSSKLNDITKPKDGLAGYQIYAGRNGYDNIFEQVEGISIETEIDRSFLNNLFGLNEKTEISYATNRYSDSILTSFGGNFNHIISSIPISGQPYPTHQFLGSIEPTYHFSFMGLAKSPNKNSIALGIQDLEHILNQCVLQAKNFSVVPDASNIAIDSIITRLLGTYKEDTLYTYQIQSKQEPISNRLDLKPNMSLHSSELFTIEGSPNAVGYNVRLSESKHYIQEEIKAVVTTENNYEKYLKQYSDLLKKSPYAQKKGFNLRPLYNKYDYMNWNTKNYNSKQWYSQKHSNARNITPSKEHDINAYHLCLLLDEINFYLGENNKIQIFSTYRGRTFKKDGVTDLLSSHSVGSATDLVVDGISSAELAAYIELLLTNDKISNDYGAASLKMQGKSVLSRTNPLSWVGLGVYGEYSIQFFEENDFDLPDMSSQIFEKLRENDFTMKRSGNNFLHIDLNLLVSFDDNSLTKRNANSLKRNRRRWVGVEDTAKFRTQENQTTEQALIDYWNFKIKNMIKYIGYNLNKLKYNSFEESFIPQGVNIIQSSDDNENVSNEEEENDSNIAPKNNKKSTRQERFESEIESQNVFATNESLKEFLKKEDNNIIFDQIKLIETVPLKTENDLSLFEKQIVISSNYTQPQGNDYNKAKEQIELIRNQLNRFKNIEIRYKAGSKTPSFPYTYQQKLIIKIKKQNYKQDRKINKELLNSFQMLASIMLIEPYLYLNEVNEESINNEMNRIMSELFGIDVLPLHFNYIESNFLGVPHMLISEMNGTLDEKKYNTNYNYSNKQLIVIGTATVLGVASAFVPATWPVLLKSVGSVILGSSVIGGVTVAAEGVLEGVSEDAILQLKRVILGFKSNENLLKNSNSYKKWIDNNASKSQDFKDELIEYGKKKLDEENEALYKDFLNQIDQSDTVYLGVTAFSEKIMYNTEIFKRFTDLSIRLKTSSAVRKMIVKETTGGDWDKYRFNGLSDRILINVLEDYLLYLFSFPMDSELLEDEDMATEVYTIQNGKVEPLIDRKLFENKDLISAQVTNETNSFDFFKKRKTELKQNQDERIAFLKNLAKVLLEDSIVLNKDILEVENSELLTIFDGKSVFELLESNAYPDITLPKSPEDFTTVTANPHIHPVFFIKDFNDYYRNDRNLNTYINNRTKISEKIVRNSKAFMAAARDGAVFKLGNDYAKNMKSLESENQKQFFENVLESNDLLMDTYEYPDGNRSITNEDFESYEDWRKSTLTNIKVDGRDPFLFNKSQNLNKMNEALYNEFKSLKSMFGSKLGYKRRKSKNNLKNLTFKNNPLEVEDYKPVEISKDSSKGITTLPSMKNAFPTFRLYLVEEDNIFSDRLTAYDDFFYYNSVISFSTNVSRDLPAGTAKIQLQNLSGLLDGTRKNDLADTDIPGDIDEDALDLKNMYRNYADTIVLRQGINIQLRAGYDSNTNNLDILLSGRITDISYSNNNTICNIVVQSFGIELDTAIKGASSFTDKNNNFKTTHHLLSHAIMSPELKHFGRRKVGRYFQTSEAMEPSLDMEEYSNTDYFDFKYMRSFMNLLEDNQVYLLFALGFLPFGSVGRVFGKKILAKIGALGSTQINQSVKWAGKAIADAGRGVYKLPVLKQIFYPGVKAGQISYNMIFKNSKNISNVIKTQKNMYGDNLTKETLERAVANELQKTNILGRLIGKNKGIDKYIDEARKLIIREVGYDDAVKLGLLTDSALKAPIKYGWTLLSADGIGRTLFKNFTFALPVAGALGVYGGLIDTLKAGYDFVASSFETQQKDRFKLTEKILMSPQDDNIFSPDPELYMIKDDKFNTPILNFLYRLADASILTYLGQNEEERREAAYKESYQLAEKRLNIFKNENLYTINGQTVWKIFKDMSYRHPGYVFGIRPYGNSMEYRMFFGLPNQRYFSKQVTNNVIDRLNRIEEGLSSSSGNGLLDESLLNSLYPVYNNENKIKQKQQLFSSLAIDEYLHKTKDRFTPYRQYHYVTAENNIISNDIVVSGHDLVNSVNVHYTMHASRDNEGSEISTIEVNSLHKVTAENKKPVVLRDPNGNIKGISNAFRWGMGELLAKSKNLYQGSLLILGNTKINTNDVIILKDNVTNMHGPLEVSYVIHSFDFQTGFITEVGVSALVTGNESLTYPTYNAMIEYEARRELFERFSSYKTFQSNNEDPKETIRDVVKEIIRQNNDKTDFKLEIDDKITNTITDEVFKSINNRKNNNLPNFITDVIPENADAIAALTRGVLSRSSAENIIKTASFVIGSSSIVSSMLIENRFNKNATMGLISNLGKGAAAKYFGIGTLTIGVLTQFGILGDIIDNSYKTGNLGKNYFKKAIFSSMKGGNNIQLYPLVKDGMPLLAGGFEEISEKDIWENVYGNIYNSMSDAVSARLSREQEYSEIGRKVLELSEVDDDWSFQTEILSSDVTAAIFGNENRKKITGWYLSEN